MNKIGSLCMYPFKMTSWANFRADFGAVFGAESMLLSCHPDGVGEAVVAHVVLPRHLALLSPRLGGTPLARRAQVLDTLIDEMVTQWV